jgi:hypothetical protein
MTSNLRMADPLERIFFFSEVRGIDEKDVELFLQNVCRPRSDLKLVLGSPRFRHEGM